MECGLWEQCPGGRCGVARSSNRQVCVFLLCLSPFHTSAVLLHKGRKTPDILVAGKLKRRSWEAASREHHAKCPLSPNWALADHLYSSSFCPCWGLDWSLGEQGAQHPAAVKAPVIPLGMFSLGGIFPFSLLPLINNLLSRQDYFLWFIHKDQKLFQLLGAAGWEDKALCSSLTLDLYSLTQHCHTDVLPLPSPLPAARSHYFHLWDVVTVWLQGRLAHLSEPAKINLATGEKMA